MHQYLSIGSGSPDALARTGAGSGSRADPPIAGGGQGGTVQAGAAGRTADSKGGARGARCRQGQPGGPADSKGGGRGAAGQSRPLELMTYSTPCCPLYIF
jgi:hypothetical protein